MGVDRQCPEFRGWFDDWLPKLRQRCRNLSYGIEISAFIGVHRRFLGYEVILVTGGAGFIGSNFVLDWLAAARRAGRQRSTS